MIDNEGTIYKPPPTLRKFSSTPTTFYQAEPSVSRSFYLKSGGKRVF